MSEVNLTGSKLLRIAMSKHTVTADDLIARLTRDEPHLRPLEIQGMVDRFTLGGSCDTAVGAALITLIVDKQKEAA